MTSPMRRNTERTHRPIGSRTEPDGIVELCSCGWESKPGGPEALEERRLHILEETSDD